MAVSLKEFNAIREYIQKGLLEECDNEGIQRIDIEEVHNNFTYEEWVNQYKPKREKKEPDSYSPEFETWWCTYPSTVKFDYKGVRFTGTRILRDKKDETYKCYQKALADCTADQLLHALKVEIEERKIGTWEKYEKGNKNYNEFNYMKATCAYLNSKRYLYYKDEEIPQTDNSEEEYGITI